MDFDTQCASLTVAKERPVMAELELENGRLHRLVADLLIKNQQLRVELKAAQRAPVPPINFPGMSNN
jgi:hypothetical protein